MDRAAVGFDVSINASTNDNKLVSLGGTPPQIGTVTRIDAGYPLFAFWGRPISYEDKNNDGLIAYSPDATINELTVGDSSVLIGDANAKHNVSTTLGLELLLARTHLGELRLTLVDRAAELHHADHAQRQIGRHPRISLRTDRRRAGARSAAPTWPGRHIGIPIDHVLASAHWRRCRNGLNPWPRVSRGRNPPRATPR